MATAIAPLSTGQIQQINTAIDHYKHTRFTTSVELYVTA